MIAIKCICFLTIWSVVLCYASQNVIKWNILADETNDISAFFEPNGSTVLVYPLLRLTLQQGNMCLVYKPELLKLPIKIKSFCFNEELLKRIASFKDVLNCTFPRSFHMWISSWTPIFGSKAKSFKEFVGCIWDYNKRKRNRRTWWDDLPNSSRDLSRTSVSFTAKTSSYIC